MLYKIKFYLFNILFKSTRPLFILIKLTILSNIRDTLKNNINYNSFGIKN